MQDFILINNDGTSYSCNPKLIKKISQTEIGKMTANASITGRAYKTVLHLSDKRLATMQHFSAALPGEQIKKDIPIYTIVDNDKKIIFSKLEQLYFSSEYSESQTAPGIVSLRGYCRSRTSSTPVLYHTILPWSTQALFRAIGIKVYFIAFASFKSTMDINDSGSDMAKNNFTDSGGKNYIGNEFSALSRYGLDSKLHFAMGIEGSSDAYFPLVSNVYEDLRVCSGLYTLPHIVVGSFSDEQLFARMLTGFLFSEFNSDLMNVANREGSENRRAATQTEEKAVILEKMFSWNKDSLLYSPSVSSEAIKSFANVHVVRKFDLDIAKRCLDGFSSTLSAGSAWT
jgi:hypothetical protein